MSLAQQAHARAAQTASNVVAVLSSLPPDRRSDALKTVLSSFGLQRKVTANMVLAGRRGFDASGALQVALTEAIQDAMLRFVGAAGPGMGTIDDLLDRAAGSGSVTPSGGGSRAGRIDNAVSIMNSIGELLTQGTTAAMSIYTGVTRVQDARDQTRRELAALQSQSNLAELEAQARAARAAAAPAPSLLPQSPFAAAGGIPWGTIAIVGGVIVAGVVGVKLLKGK